MATIFTHTFEYSEDSRKVEGEVEFNEDGLVSWKPVGTPELGLEESTVLLDIFKHLQTLYKINEGLTKFKVEEKI